MDYMIGIHITVIISVLLLIRLAFPRKFGNVPLSFGLRLAIIGRLRRGLDTVNNSQMLEEKYFASNNSNKLAMNRKSCIFATNNKVKTMNTDLLQKRELALKKFKASKERKKAYIQELEKSMRQEYKERTGKDAVSFTAW